MRYFCEFIFSHPLDAIRILNELNDQIKLYMFHVTINLCAKPCLPGWEKGEPQGPREKQRRGCPGCGQPAWRATLRRGVCHQEKAKPSTGPGGTANSGVASIQRWHLPFIQSTCYLHRHRHELSAEMCLLWVTWPRSHHPHHYPRGPGRALGPEVECKHVCVVGEGAGGRSNQESWGLERQTSNRGKHENWIWPPSQSMEYKPPNLPKSGSWGGAPEVDWAGEGGHMGSRYRASSTQRPAPDWGP